MSKNKQKGTRWEVAVRDLLNDGAVLWEVYRPAQEGFRDTGDLHGFPFFAIQCKNWKDVTSAIREGIDGVRKQAEHYSRPWGFAAVKRARKSTGEGYAVMTLAQMREVAYVLSRAAVLLDDRGVSMDELIEEAKAL